MNSEPLRPLTTKPYNLKAHHAQWLWRTLTQQQDQEIQQLRDEIKRLKKTTRRPKIKPSTLLKPPPAEPAKPKGKRPGSAKRSKTKDIRIDHDKLLVPENLPEGARLEGYRDFVVQDIVLETRNTRYRRAVYRLPDGSLAVAQRPPEVDSHFGPGLLEFVLLQTHQNHVTQGRLLEHLHELRVDISAGQLSNVLLKGHESFHAEKDELLPTARQISDHLHCDDTSARHQGQAAVCTHIGNELFASFSTTDSKSRLNFLRLLRQPDERYRWCEEAQSVLEVAGASGKLQAKMDEQADGVWLGQKAWEEQLTQWGIESQTDRRRVSEAALFGTLLTEDWYDDLGFVSDDAPQFKLLGFVHGLCWVHGERKIDRLIPLTTRHRQAKELAQSTFWEIYQSLQAYRRTPNEAAKASIESRFDQLCGGLAGYPDLNEALRLLYAKRDEFLAVLEQAALAAAQQLVGERHSGVHASSEDQWGHAQRRRPSLPRYVHESEEHVPEASG